MDAREYLEQVVRLDQMINMKLDQVYTLRCLAQKVTTTFSLTPKGFGQGGNGSPIENRIVRILELEAELNRDIDAYVDLKRIVCAAIGQLTKREHQILLELRYINGLSWEMVSEKMDISRMQAYRCHKASLEEFGKILEKSF